jgi:hypothetical protein
MTKPIKRSEFVAKVVDIASRATQIQKFREEFGARTSRVVPVSSFPEGTRKRGWGWLHDQIWFYVAHEPANLGGIPVSDDCDVEYEDEDGRTWRWFADEARWLRLYMTRRMLWFGGGRSVRIQHFFSGDDSIPHTHPWWFVTVPVSSYEEVVWTGHSLETNTVSALRPHFRHTEYRHRVLEPSRPFWTIVVTGPKKSLWGFYPRPDFFVPFDEWTDYR